MSDSNGIRTKHEELKIYHNNYNYNCQCGILFFTPTSMYFYIQTEKTTYLHCLQNLFYKITIFSFPRLNGAERSQGMRPVTKSFRYQLAKLNPLSQNSCVRSSNRHELIYRLALLMQFEYMLSLRSLLF